jgi:hypothetical protein
LYVGAVDKWREELKGLRDMEEMSGLLCVTGRFCMSLFFIFAFMFESDWYGGSVTRLIKASKSTKSNRDSSYSLSSPSQTGAAAAASTSLRSSTSLQFPSLPFSLSPSPTSNPKLSVPKLSVAQAELQACEAHLASLEKDLEKRRVQAVRDGLGGRCRALVECAWVWGEVEKEGLRALKALKGELVL